MSFYCWPSLFNPKPMIVQADLIVVIALSNNRTDIMTNIRYSTWTLSINIINKQIYQNINQQTIDPNHGMTLFYEIFAC